MQALKTVIRMITTLTLLKELAVKDQVATTDHNGRKVGCILNMNMKRRTFCE
jgi:hypothetical protein